MDMEKIDKATIKAIIKEVIKEDFSLFKEAVKEILIENQVISSQEEEGRRKKLEKMIKDDFDKYDEVFRALS